MHSVHYVKVLRWPCFEDLKMADPFAATFAWTTKLLGIGPKGFAELTVSDTNMNMR